MSRAININWQMTCPPPQLAKIAWIGPCFNSFSFTLQIRQTCRYWWSASYNWLVFCFLAIDDDPRFDKAETYTRLGTCAPASNDRYYFDINFHIKHTKNKKSLQCFGLFVYLYLGHSVGGCSKLRYIDGGSPFHPKESPARMQAFCIEAYMIELQFQFTLKFIPFISFHSHIILKFWKLYNRTHTNKYWRICNNIRI